MHSFVSAAEVSGDLRLVEASRKLVSWWIDHVPADWVPYYDFDDPDRINAPRDSSAAAQATSALMRLKGTTAWSGRLAGIIDSTLRELCLNYLSVGGLLAHSSFGRLGEQLYGGKVGADQPKVRSSSRFPQEDIISQGNYFIVDIIYRTLLNCPQFPSLIAP
jgi:unsaturated chondroitin disaccharide hydrolase